jgi:PIN domain nuclease of toxin-antitoxin system
MGVTYLLDTHVLIWLAGFGGKPNPATSKALHAADARLVVSAVSSFEIATKVRLGKLDSAAALVPGWARALTEIGAFELSLNSQHALTAGGLEWDHRDPFDRLLVAQAQLEELTLVTADRAMHTAPGVRLLAW